jgi:3-methyladenine DNA glycosylase AlkD
MATPLKQIQRELEAAGDPDKARFLQGFFKTGPGQYAEGDRFRGLTVPVTRAIAKRYLALTWGELDSLLRAPFHEDRLAALMVLTLRAEAKKASPVEKERILDFYLARTRFVNNWDLVDLSAPSVVGRRLVERNDPSLLFKLALSSLLWERRIGMVASHAFIRARQTPVAYILAEMLLGDRHDLMHKASGWMLREAGKRDPAGLKTFLGKHAGVMPRTMLRYSIERLSPAERLRWMQVRSAPAT